VTRLTYAALAFAALPACSEKSAPGNGLERTEFVAIAANNVPVEAIVASPQGGDTAASTGEHDVEAPTTPSPSYLAEGDWLALVASGKMLEAAQAYPQLDPARRTASSLQVAPATLKKLEAAAKKAERARAWSDAIAIRRMLAGLGDLTQLVAVASIEKKAAVDRLEADIRTLEKAKEWRALVAAYADMERLTGKKLTSKIRAAEAKAERAEREAAHARSVEVMRQGAWLRDNTRVIVGGTEWRGCLGYSCARAPAKFLLVQVGVVNGSTSTIHVNPNNVTLASCGQESPPETATYSISNHLPAVNVGPGNNAQGWLAFAVFPDCKHVLYYRSLGSGQASVPVVGPLD